MNQKDQTEALPSSAPEPFASPLLSEFGAVEARAFRPWKWLILATIFIGSISIIFGHLAGANCIRLKLELSGSQRFENIVYGYLGELAHGPFYLTGIPLALSAIFLFIRTADYTLRRLAASSKLFLLSPDNEPLAGQAAVLEHINAINRRVFRLGLPAIAFFAAAVIAWAEVVGYDDVAFGWVQAREVRAYFSSGQTQPLDSIGNQASLQALLPQARALCPDNQTCPLHLRHVSGGSISQEEQAWFWPFVVISLILQWFHATIGYWVTAKVIFFLSVLSTAIGKPRLAAASPPMTDHSPTLRLMVEFDDTEHKFGLGSLDAVYQRVWLILVIVSAWAFMVASGNQSKGSFNPFSQELSVGTFFQQTITFSLPSLMMLGLCVVPMIILDIRLEHMKSRTASELEKQIIAAESDSARKELQEKRSRCNNQSAASWKDPYFWTFLSINLLLLLGFPLFSRFLSSDQAHLGKQLASISSFICGDQP